MTEIRMRETIGQTIVTHIASIGRLEDRRDFCDIVESQIARHDKICLKAMKIRAPSKL